MKVDGVLEHLLAFFRIDETTFPKNTDLDRNVDRGSSADYLQKIWPNKLFFIDLNFTYIIDRDQTLLQNEFS